MQIDIARLTVDFVYGADSSTMYNADHKSRLPISGSQQGEINKCVIPHLEMRAYDWSKSRHVTFTEIAILPSRDIIAFMNIHVCQCCPH